MGLPGRLLPWFVTKKRERKERKRRKEGGEGVTSLVWRSVEECDCGGGGGGGGGEGGGGGGGERAMEIPS